MIPRIARVLVLALVPVLAGAAERPPAVEAILADGAAACAGVEDGTFALAEDAVAHVDLTGDGQPDWVVAERGFRCSTSAALYCGTGGCMVHFVVGSSVDARIAKGWTRIDWPPATVILLELHGTECGGTNLRRCVEAITWSEGAFRSIRSGD